MPELPSGTVHGTRTGHAPGIRSGRTRGHPKAEKAFIYKGFGDLSNARNYSLNTDLSNISILFPYNKHYINILYYNFILIQYILVLTDIFLCANITLLANKGSEKALFFSENIAPR